MCATWLYLCTEKETPLYTTGFYSPSGEWHPDHDYGSKEEAAARVHYLNGGDGPDNREREA